MIEPPNGEEHDPTRRLRELLHKSAPHFDPLRVDQLVLVRTRSRAWAATAAVAVVLTVVGALVLVNRGSQRPDHAGLSTTSPNAVGLDDLARRAPCNLINNRHPADAGQVARFGTVAVVQCATGTQRYPREGEWQITSRNVLIEGLSALITALEASDKTNRSSGLICGGVAYGPPNILLVDRTGHYLHPRFPTTACGAPQPAFFRALKAVKWRTVSVTRGQQVESQAAIDAGCVMQWKSLQMLGIDTLHATTAGPVLTGRSVASLKVCIYMRSPNLDAGSFQRGLMLSPAQSRDLRTALAGRGPGTSQTCDAQPSFAVVFAGGDWVQVELGGCWRVLRGDTVGTAQTDTVKRILKVS